jgi:acetyl-CoA carboxylase, biotin carboxylase subunit
MGAEAIKIARAVDYLGAGTVEFLVADATRDFYFLEMNTRLQVEHPVTELVTGRDLVQEQIRVAAGHPLSFTQDDISWDGHAIECRVYAEDPANNFLPSPGTIAFLQSPAGPGIRDDSGVREGSEVSIHYDPMISKLAAWGRTRGEAIERLRRALDEYQIEGIKTTLPFFREIVRDDEFIAARLDTGFISRFNQRRDATSNDGAGPRRSADERLRDIAIIVAALHHGSRQPALPGAPPTTSQWKMSGRLDRLRDGERLGHRGAPEPFPAK